MKSMTWTPDRLFSSCSCTTWIKRVVTSALLFFAHPFGHHDRLSRRISATGLGFGVSPDICFVVSDPLPHGEQARKIQHCVYLILRQQNNDSGFSSPVACFTAWKKTPVLFPQAADSHRCFARVEWRPLACCVCLVAGLLYRASGKVGKHICMHFKIYIALQLSDFILLKQLTAAPA